MYAFLRVPVFETMNRFKISIVILFLMGSCTLFAQERRALAIGIGQYQDPAWGRINADKDLYYIGKILDMYDFEDVTYLKNEEAVKDAIVKEFDNLIRRSGPGDIVYIHFSGHGQLVTDMDGDDKEDGLDESWIPYDAYFQPCEMDDGSKHLLDDEVNALLARLRRKVGVGGHIMVVVDACHSGGSSRGTEQTQGGFISRGVKEVFTPSNKTASRYRVKEDWLLISACKDYQDNYELKKPAAGRLTYSLYQLREELPYMSNDDLEEELGLLMDSPEEVAPVPQNPHLDGREYNVRDIFKL